MDADRNCRRYLRLALLAGAILWHGAAAAQQWSVQFPIFSACTPAKPPQLPLRWRAVGLMTPFLKGQLDVGEFVYDGTLPAMRATVYGLESGAVDLLITETDTYVLFGPHRSPNGCSSLGRKLRPPPRQWLAQDAVCFGESPVEGKPAQWWQSPRGEEPASWHWFSTETHLPWRSLFLTKSSEPAVVGDYAMTYFPTFASIPESNLSDLQAMCAKQAKPIAAERLPETVAARDLMAIKNDAAEAERAERISRLIPGLSHDGCASVKPPRWPDQFVMSAILTPTKFGEGPYSSLIYYDWTKAQSQVALLFQGKPPALKDYLSLRPQEGFRVGLPSFRGPACAAAFPGIVRPDWMTRASCECKGVIGRAAALGADTDTQILSCPIKWQGDRVMWAWYTTAGRPRIFMEPSGAGLMFADYRDWLPGQTAPAEDLRLPQACLAPDRSKPSSSNISCSDCHTTPW